MENLVEFLMVEDNASDIRLTQEFLKTFRILNKINFVSDGQEALDFLRRQGEKGQARPPDIILFSLRLLIREGEKCLAEIKQDAALACIPIVVLTAFEGEEDVICVANPFSTLFIPKPLDLQKTHSILAHIENFWFSIARETL